MLNHGLMDILHAKSWYFQTLVTFMFFYTEGRVLHHFLSCPDLTSMLFFKMVTYARLKSYISYKWRKTHSRNISFYIFTLVVPQGGIGYKMSQLIHSRNRHFRDVDCSDVKEIPLPSTPKGIPSVFVVISAVLQNAFRAASRRSLSNLTQLV